MTTRQGVPLRFATFLAPNMLPVYRFLAERIARRVGCPVELVVGTSFDQFERGDADLGVICGLPYVWLAARHPVPVEPLAAPVLVGERYAGRPVYYSDVIVHRDSSITHLEDLHDRSWAYSAPASHSGHTVTLGAAGRARRRPVGAARARPRPDRPVHPGRGRRLRRHPRHAGHHPRRRLDQPDPASIYRRGISGWIAMVGGAVRPGRVVGGSAWIHCERSDGSR